MKVSTMALLGAVGLASANPLRIVMLDGGARPRFGAAAAGVPVPPPQPEAGVKNTWDEGIPLEAISLPFDPEHPELANMQPPPPCHHGHDESKVSAVKEKLSEVANYIKSLFGVSEPKSFSYRINPHLEPAHKEKFTIIKASFSADVPPMDEDGTVHILPFMPGPAVVNDVPPVEPHPHPHPHPHHHHSHGQMWHHRMRNPNSFVSRLHRALHSLSPWEGRALAFVVGCGIGVLLRMVWVFMILFYRHVVRQTTQEVSLPVDSDDDFVGSPRGSGSARRPTYMIISPPEYEEVTEEKMIPSTSR